MSKLDPKTRLRVEISKNNSGKIQNENQIELLREKDYCVKDYPLDGDAPKQFMHAYFYEENSRVRRANPHTWHQYIAKTAEKWYPHESIIEYLINRIGQVLKLELNEIKLVRANGQIRFLSKYFLSGNERLIHGAEICGQHIGDMEMADEIANNKVEARKYFTFEFIVDAIKEVFPYNHEELIGELVKMIAFDAIVGNNDRHFYNWGVIDRTRKTKIKPKFAPLYDSARGLLWNLSDDNIVNTYRDFLRGAKSKTIRYIESASPRISLEGNSEVNHFELIHFLKNYNNEYKDIVIALASQENEVLVLNMIKDEFSHFFIHERFELIKIILRNRFETIRGV